MKFSVKNVKILKTCNLYLCAALVGMCIAIPGPTLLDLQSIVNTDAKHIAFVYTARSTGYLFGSIFGGILFDLTNKKQLIFTVFNLINALSTIAIPWGRVIGALTGFMSINGFTMGLLDTGLNVCTLYLWGKESGSFFQALHFTYGVGSSVAPLIAAPFLNVHDPEGAVHNISNFTHETLLTQNFSKKFFIPSETIPSVTYAYTIIGGIGVLVTITFFIACITSPIDDNGQNEEDNPTRPTSLKFVILIVGLNFLLIFVETGTEIGFAQMVTTYAVKGPLKLTKTVGSYITSTFWAAFTIFRLLSVFFAMKLSNRTLVILDISVTSIGAVILISLGTTYEWALWLASVFLGAGVASLFASAVAWVDQYITVSNKIVSIFVVGEAFGEMVVPYTITTYINEIPEFLNYVVVASCVLSAVCIFFMFLVLRNKPEKYLTKKEIEDLSNQSNKGEISNNVRY